MNPVVLIPILKSQYNSAKQLAEEVWRDKRDANFNDRACRDTHDIEFWGFLGEIIYADFYCVPRPQLLKGRLDGGVDFILDGKRVQVKTTPYTQPPFYLILFPEQINNEVDYYALLSLNLTEMTATIIAEVPYPEFKENCFEHDFGYGKRLVMKFE